MTEVPPSLITKCDEDLIHAAFDRHLATYGEGKRAWDTPYHINMWQRAERAFAQQSLDDFDFVYEELRRRWQVFRGGRVYWTSEQAFRTLQSSCAGVKTKRLSDLSLSDLPHLWKVLESVRDIKKTSSGCSVVAISKFLHFSNPRLFIIVDDGIIWNWVLRHHWVWEPIRQMREFTDRTLFGATQKHDDRVCDLGTYLAVLAWSSSFVRAHPGLSTCFAEYIQRHADGATLPSALIDYQAAAMEWFLLGVVEIPPTGWNVSKQQIA